MSSEALIYGGSSSNFYVAKVNLTTHSTQILSTFLGHDDTIRGFAYTGLNSTLISIADDGCLNLWSLPVEILRTPTSTTSSCGSTGSPSSVKSIPIQKPIQIVAIDTLLPESVVFDDGYAAIIGTNRSGSYTLAVWSIPTGKVSDHEVRRLLRLFRSYLKKNSYVSIPF